MGNSLEPNPTAVHMRDSPIAVQVDLRHCWSLTAFIQNRDETEGCRSHREPSRPILETATGPGSPNWSFRSVLVPTPQALTGAGSQLQQHRSSLVSSTS